MRNGLNEREVDTAGEAQADIDEAVAEAGADGQREHGGAAVA
ncbi:hypothetical protein ACPSM1_23080 [Micromonospora chersina]